MDAAPRDPIELAVFLAWQSVLGSDRLSVRDSFAELGGDRRAAADVIERLEERLGVWLPPSSVQDFPRLEQLAAVYRLLVPVERYSGLVRFFAHDEWVDRRPSGDLYIVHGGAGDVVAAFGLGHRLRSSWRVWGLDLPMLHGGPDVDLDIRALAQRHMRVVRPALERGPVVLGGFSLGGIVAYEMAVRLAAEPGVDLEQLLLLDTLPPEQSTLPKMVTTTEARRKLFEHLSRAGSFPPGTSVDLLERWTRIQHGIAESACQYELVPYGGRTAVFATRGPERASVVARWAEVIAAGALVDVEAPGDHFSMFEDEHADALADAVLALLESDRV